MPRWTDLPAFSSCVPRGRTLPPLAHCATRDISTTQRDLAANRYQRRRNRILESSPQAAAISHPYSPRHHHPLDGLGHAQLHDHRAADFAARPADARLADAILRRFAGKAPDIHPRITDSVVRDCIAAAPDSALGPDGVRASACGACVDRATPASIRAAQWILDFGEIQDRLDEPIITRIPKKALPHETRHIAPHRPRAA